jgi:hypothetical protein
MKKLHNKLHNKYTGKKLNDPKSTTKLFLFHRQSNHDRYVAPKTNQKNKSNSMITNL